MKGVQYLGEGRIAVAETSVVKPQHGEVRLAVAYCGICGTDLHILHGAMDRRVAVPQVIGHEMSGVVAEVGEDVVGLLPGDAVVVRPLDDRQLKPADRGLRHICSNLKFLGVDTPGALQSSWTVPAFTVHKLPPQVPLRRAALAEPLAVACHDVRMAGVAATDVAVVLGAGPIGMLIGMVARQSGARVVVSEVNEYRLAFARTHGFDAVNPLSTDLNAHIREVTSGAGADVVFEVSGAPAALLGATELLALRGRLLMVAIYPNPAEVNLFQVFWKELRIQGARVYEPEDYERAITLIAENELALDDMISAVLPMREAEQAFHTLQSDRAAMKILIDCEGDESTVS